MSFDLTGNALSGYMLRVVREIVSRNHRFQDSLGAVAISTSNQVNFGDVQVIIRDVSSDGARQSFDYFVATQTGRAILTKVGDKDGSFFEWVNEIDATLETPASGVYYFNVDSIDEKTRDVCFTLQKYRWVQGSVKSAFGTRIGFREGIDTTTLTVLDPTTGQIPGFTASSYAIYLLSKVGGIEFKYADGVALTPNVDYWVEQQVSTVVLQTTVYGPQIVTIPSGYLTISLVDQNGYSLRPNIDYTIVGGNTVELGNFTPSGSTISCNGIFKLDPTVAANLVNPENILGITLGPQETLVPDQFFVSTQAGSHIQVPVSQNGTVTLQNLLPPGGRLTYEARISQPQIEIVGKKMALNRSLIPGLSIAIGDNVTVGDQCAILVSPFQTETYEVYGAKENVSFTLDVKANDPNTTSTLAELIKHELLVYRRGQIETDGLTIFSINRSNTSQARDSSGTAPSYVSSLGVSSMADWRVFRPLVTRVTNFDVTPSLTTAYPGDTKVAARYSCLQATGFLPDYR